MADALSILSRGEISERGVGALVEVVTTVLVEDDAGFDERAEELAVEQLVAHARVEALGESVLPGRTRRDEESANVGVVEEGSDGRGDELGTVVRADVRGRPSFSEEPAKDVEEVLAANRASRMEREGLAGELVDEGENLERLPVDRLVAEKVVGPNVIGSLGGEAMASVLGLPDESPRPTPLRHLQLELFPQAVNALVVHAVPLAAKRGGRAAIAVARMLLRVVAQAFSKGFVRLTSLRLMALRRTVLAQQATRSPLGDAMAHHGAPNGLALPLGRQIFPSMTSLRMRLSRACSATSFLSFAFSFSSSRRRFASLLPTSAYCRRQR